MKSLTEFPYQSHVTSVLRAMVISKKVNQHIALVGNDALGEKILKAFIKALNCDAPIKGAHCGECLTCTTLEPVIYASNEWYYRPEWYGVKECKIYYEKPAEHAVYFSTYPAQGYLAFALSPQDGRQVYESLLPLFLRSLQGNRKEVMLLSDQLSKQLPYEEFRLEYLNLSRSLLYLQNNMEIVEVQHLDILKKLAVKIPSHVLTALMRFLWDAEAQSSLGDSLGIQTLSLLITELLAPTTAVDIYTGYSEEPITTVETVSTVEQPLTLEKMFEIVNS